MNILSNIRRRLANTIKNKILYPAYRSYYHHYYNTSIQDKSFKRGRVFDCVMYSNEDELLKLRFEELGNFVDYFIVVEGNHTFRGVERELNFPKISDIDAKIRKKIRYIEVNNLTNAATPMENEISQRRQIMRGLYDLNSNDYVLIGDVDELPNPEKIWTFGAFDQYFSYYFLNCLKKYKLPCTVGLLGKQLIEKPDPQYFRINRFRFGLIPNGGWHFSYLADPDRIREKITTFAHPEWDTSRYTDIGSIVNRVLNHEDLFERAGEELEIVAFGKWLPTTIVNNPEKWAKWICYSS